MPNSKAHAVLTGPIRGAVTLPDGTSVDVTPEVILVDSPETAAEVAHQIGLHWQQPQNVHPAQIDVNAKGDVTVNDFVYDDAHYRAHVKNQKKG